MARLERRACATVGAGLLILTAACAPRPAPIPSSTSTQGIYHVVKRGENLFRIGKAYDVSYRVLAQLNGITEPNRITVGQRLFIPGATKQLPVELITPVETTASPGRATEAELPADGFALPVSGAMNSGFGPRGATFHDGVDIAAPEGTPIHAIDGGEVIYSSQLRGYGNIVIIRHPSGFASVYAHNRQNLVKEGQAVARGDIVAEVGSTGRVTGPHLHFEIRKDNVARDPLHYLPQLCCNGSSPRVLPKEPS